MHNADLRQRFAGLTTAHVADACVRAQAPVRCAPSAVQAVLPGTRVAGRVLPARHAGSVDIFLEALEGAEPGDVLVVDNDGRTDESCVGDLIALEAQAAGLDGIVIWGLHRDTADITSIGLPVFSAGSIPAGPLSARDRAPDALRSAVVGEWTLRRDDLVLADEDGVLFIPGARADEILATAEAIRDTERRQASRVRAGRSLRDQVQFSAYLAGRAQDQGLTFRDHLRAVGGSIEELRMCPQGPDREREYRVGGGEVESGGEVIAVRGGGGGELSLTSVGNVGVHAAAVVLAHAALEEPGLLEPVGQSAGRALVEAESLSELGDPHAVLLRRREPAQRPIVGQPQAVLTLQHLGELLLHPGVQRCQGMPGQLISVRILSLHASPPCLGP
jgi:regulator of RNase E activity RraA